MLNMQFDLGTVADLVPEDIYLMIEQEIAEIIAAEPAFGDELSAYAAEVEQAA